MRVSFALLVMVAVGLAAPSALARTVYTVAGGGDLALSTDARDAPLATDVRLSSSARTESLPDGSFRIGDHAGSLGPGRSLWRVGIDGRIRLFRRGAGDFARGPDGSIFYMRFGVLFRLTPDGNRVQVADGLSGLRPTDTYHHHATISKGAQPRHEVGRQPG
jgi:hypothetical protein